jgi:hypothetical protein
MAVRAGLRVASAMNFRSNAYSLWRKAPGRGETLGAAGRPLLKTARSKHPQFQFQNLGMVKGQVQDGFPRAGPDWDSVADA